MILFYNSATDAFEPRLTKVSYTDTIIGDVVTYPDNVSDIETMVRNNPLRFSNFKIEGVTLDDKQLKRLDKVNKELKVDEGHHKSSFVTEASEYVEHGVVRLKNVRTEFHKFSTKEIKESTKNYFVSKLAEKIAGLRYEKEVGGITVNGKTINTSRESQNSITTTLAAVQAGLLKEVVYKTENGFVTLSAKEYTDLAMAVINHVNKCFKAEADAIKAFNALSLEELEEDTNAVNAEGEASLTSGTVEERAKFAFNKFFAA